MNIIVRDCCQIHVKRFGETNKLQFLFRFSAKMKIIRFGRKKKTRHLIFFSHHKMWAEVRCTRPPRPWIRHLCSHVFQSLFLNKMVLFPLFLTSMLLAWLVARLIQAFLLRLECGLPSPGPPPNYSSTPKGLRAPVTSNSWPSHLWVYRFLSPTARVFFFFLSKRGGWAGRLSVAGLALASEHVTRPHSLPLGRTIASVSQWLRLRLTSLGC